MSALILHQYAASPFCEKIRIALGYKSLAWQAVEIAAFPPRPQLAPLTAGYRRAPVLQVGADIYCDTALILATLEACTSEPSLYGPAPVGQIEALAAWADRALFMSSASLVTAVIGDDIPDAFLVDRRQFMDHDFSRKASEAGYPIQHQRVAAAMTQLIDMLADGRRFLFGNSLSAADLAAWHPLWFIRSYGGAPAMAGLPFTALQAWMTRIEAIGHAPSEALDASRALAVARAATPRALDEPATASSSAEQAHEPVAYGLSRGQAVQIHADEPADPITGRLVAVTPHTLIIAQENQAAGRVHVHFPRRGYQVIAA